MDPDEYDQYELFQELQGLQPYWDKCQWLKDPSWVKLHTQILDLRNTQEWSTRWFSPEEILDVQEPSQRLDVSFHDPQKHSQQFKRSHVLPQGSWIPSDCLPTSEEQLEAEEELSHHSAASIANAVTLSVKHFIPHEQHEYSLMAACDKCLTAIAVPCIVCDTTLCNNCRNALYPYKEADGTVIRHDTHPVQCPCTMRDFQLALMRARKADKEVNKAWSQAPGDEKIAPLAAVRQTRSLVTLVSTSATALDYQNEENRVRCGPIADLISKGEENLEPASEGESDRDDYRANVEASATGSYFNLRIMDRRDIIGATSPQESEAIQRATAPPITLSVVREILSPKDVVQDQEVLDRLAKFDEFATLSASALDEATHCFRNRRDMESEARHNQGGVAAFRAFVQQKRELLPFNSTFFGRGK